MPSGKFVDISIIGDKSLQRKLKKLELKDQKKAVRRALRASAKRIHPLILREVVSGSVGVDTGNLQDAVADMKVKAIPVKRGTFGVGIPFPTRGELNIPASDPYFYPAILEYGSPRIRPRAWIRGTVNRVQDQELKRIATDIGREIERAFGK